MKSDSSLFELIQSLSPSEKTLIKKAGKKAGTSTKAYLEIFDAYASQTEWNESRVIKKSGFESATGFSVAKHYLFHSVLESLIEVRAKTESSAPETCLAKARILFDRSFYVSATKQIRKGIDAAHKSEDHLILFELLNLEQMIRAYLPKENKRSLLAIMDEKNSTLEKIRFTEYARQLNAKMLLLYQTVGVGRSQEDIQNYSKIFEDASNILSKPAFDGTISGGIYLLNCQVFYHNITGNLTESLKDIQALLMLLDENPGVRRTNLTLYISSVNNLALLHLYLGEFEKAETLIDRLEELPSSSLKESNAIFVCRYNTRFELFEKKGELNNAFLLSQKLKEELPDFSRRLSEQYTGHLLYYSFRTCFYLEKFKEAQHWLNQLLKSGSRAKNEVIAIARISEMILQYERKNFDSIEQLLSSAERFFEKNKTLYKCEELMIRFFRRHGGFDTDQKSFEELHASLVQLEADPLEQKVFTYFDLSAWALSHIRRKSMAIILKEKKDADEKD